MECVAKQIMQLNGSAEEFEMLSSILNRVSSAGQGKMTVTLSSQERMFAQSVMGEIDGVME